jgi:hypothetical protein
MKKNKLVGRNLTTEESRKFWEAVKSDAKEVRLEPEQVANMAFPMRVESDVSETTTVEMLLQALREPIDSSYERDAILTKLLGLLDAAAFMRAAFCATDSNSLANFARGLALIGPDIGEKGVSHLLNLSLHDDADVAWAAVDALATFPITGPVRVRMLELTKDSDSDRRRFGEEAWRIEHD